MDDRARSGKCTLVFRNQIASTSRRKSSNTSARRRSIRIRNVFYSSRAVLPLGDRRISHATGFDGSNSIIARCRIRTDSQITRNRKASHRIHRHDRQRGDLRCNVRCSCDSGHSRYRCARHGADRRSRNQSIAPVASGTWKRSTHDHRRSAWLGILGRLCNGNKVAANNFA